MWTSTRERETCTRPNCDKPADVNINGQMLCASDAIPLIRL